MGSSHTTARLFLKNLKVLLGRELDEDDIGQLIQEFRNRSDARMLNKMFGRNSAST